MNPTLRCVICRHELEEKPSGVEIEHPETHHAEEMILVRLCDDCWEKYQRLEESTSLA